MSDMFEEFKRAAGGPGAEVGDGLRRADVGVTVDAVVRGRRRRAAGEGAVAVVAVGALAIAGWQLTAFGESDTEPATMPTFTEDGAISVYPELYDGALCNQEEGGPGAYVPFGEQGAHFVGPAAQELNLEVTGTLVSQSGGGTAVALAPGEHEFSEPNGESPTMPAVQFYATWDGDARLSITAAAYLVVDGWTITLPWQSNSDLFSAQPWIDNPLPAYDADADSSTIAASNILDTFCVIDIEASAPVEFVYPGGPAEVHTVVQVHDENGVVIAQYFDALEADRSVVTFNALEGQPGEVSLPDVTQADIERTTAARAAKATEQAAGAADGAVTAGSAANGLEESLAESGMPLADVGLGYRVRTQCTARADLLNAEGAAVTVLKGTAEVPPVPTTWPASEFAKEYGTIPLDPEAFATYSEHDWYIGHEVQVLFTDPNDTSDVRGQVTGVFAWSGSPDNDTSDPTKGVFTFPIGSPCDDTEGLVPGTYHAIVALDGAPDELRESFGDDSGFAETWLDLGEIRVTE